MLIEFTYSTYCQGTQDSCTTMCFVPDAKSVEEAVCTIKDTYPDARNFVSKTLMSVWRSHG